MSVRQRQFGKRFRSLTTIRQRVISPTTSSPTRQIVNDHLPTCQFANNHSPTCQLANDQFKKVAIHERSVRQRACSSTTSSPSCQLGNDQFTNDQFANDHSPMYQLANNKVTNVSVRQRQFGKRFRLLTTICQRVSSPTTSSPTRQIVNDHPPTCQFANNHSPTYQFANDQFKKVALRERSVRQRACSSTTSSPSCQLGNNQFANDHSPTCQFANDHSPTSQFDND